MGYDYQGLRTVIYRVPDLEAAKEWYSEAFNTEPYFDEPFYIGFNIGGYELGLMPMDGADASARPTDRVTAYWGVEDIDKAYRAMLAMDAAPCEAPQNVGGEVVVASVFDPWGNAIGLIYNPEFRADKS